MYCQQLLSVVKLGGVCVPFGHKVKACTCSETYICIGYVLPTIGGCCLFGGCTFVLDIICQQLWSVVQLGGVCVPFGYKVGACTCSETYICIGYVLPTIVDVHLYWIYSANNCGVLFSWGLSVCPSSTRLGHLHVLRYIFVLDMFCQQLWGVVRLRVVHLYWIYSANNCRVLFSWGLSVCPSGTRLGHLHVLRYIFVLDMFCQQLWGVVRLGGVHLYWIYSANN